MKRRQLLALLVAGTMVLQAPAAVTAAEVTAPEEAGTLSEEMNPGGVLKR